MSSCRSANIDANQQDNGQSDPNFKNGIYVNNHIAHPDKSFFTFLKMRWFGDHVWFDHNLEAHLIPTQPADLKQIQSHGNQVTWLGHSTFLLQVDGLNILTDPMFSERASPVSFAGPKRYTPVATSISALPRIDIVMISHNHYDHLDESSIKALGNEVHYIVPSGLKSWFMDLGIEAKRVTQLRWWQEATVAKATITATPSQHWSARGLGDRHKSHWASWLVTIGDWSFWFAGDTGYNDKDFLAIGQYIKQQKLNLELALIPIGAYGPRSFMKDYHVNTEEAVQIHKEIGSKLSIGMHWGAFPLTSERPMEPYEKLLELSRSGAVGDSPFTTLKIGETKAL